MAARKQILRLLAGSQKSLAARNVALVQKRGLLLSPSAQEAAIANAFFKPKLVIFDKDGTLVCFHTMWTPWCHAMADRMTHATGEPDVVDNLFEVLGYDHKERKVRLGALAENTHPQIRDLIHDMLVFSHGMSPVKAKDVVNETWQDTPEDMKIKTTGNLQKLFERLKAQDIKIAICTSDSREGTMEFVKREKLSHLIDAVVCGDDSFSRPKPNPHNAMYLCDKLGISPTDTIMVGDTPADTLMGQQANLGLTVGVLTGVGNMHDLADADVIVADVQECVEMILPCPEKSRQRVHQVTTRGLSKIAQGSWLFHGRNGNLPQGSRAYSTRVPGFSHIVIGAGSAGCVMTNRLTEDRQ